MKNLVQLVTARDVTDYVQGLWQTDLFRASHVADPARPEGYIARHVAAFARLPRVFFDMTVPEVEHSHFAPWFGALHHRTYATPAIHDLLLLHELVHAATLEPVPHLGWRRWSGTLIRNEQTTAVESEVGVYWALPELRALTFPFEIWADRYLRQWPVGGPAMPAPELWSERRRAMRAPTDDIERGIAHFRRQNWEWAEIWKQNFGRVERHMADVHARSATDRAGALEAHVHWLLHETGRTPDRPYPFPDEAEAFAAVFHGHRPSRPAFT